MSDPDKDTIDASVTGAGPRLTIDKIEKRWFVGTPAVAGFRRRTIAAIACLAGLLAILYLLGG